MAELGVKLSITALRYALTLHIEHQALNGPARWRESYLLGGSQRATKWTRRVNQIGHIVTKHYGEVCKRVSAVAVVSR